MERKFLRLAALTGSVPFNPDVASVFFRAGMVESWGRGIERILEACREAGTPEPELRHEPSGLWVVFQFLPAGGDPVTGETAGRTPVETPVKTPVKTRKMSVETRETPVKTPDRIVELLRTDPHITLAEVAERIGKSLRTVERAAAQLVDDGRLRRVGPRKSGHWETVE